MLKNLIGHNLKMKGMKEQSHNNVKTGSVDNLLTSNANKKLSKGQREEFSKLLLGGESKGQKSLQTANVAKGLLSKSKLHKQDKQILKKPINEKISHQEVRELLKEGKTNTNTLVNNSKSPKIAKAMAKHTTPTSLISILSSTEKTPVGKHSDIDNILGTKNIVELQKAKTSLANSKLETTLESKQAPKLAAEGVKTNALLGKSTQAIIDSAQATPEKAVEGTKDNNLLRMASTNLLKGTKTQNTHNKQFASGADFLANRQVLNNQPSNEYKASNSLHMNKFAKEASHKNNSIIRMKNEVKVEDFSSDITTRGERRAPQVQNNLIGALGNTNSTNDFRPEINLGKAPEVLDLSNVSNADQMIKEVTNYIEMNRIENGKSLQVLVKHNELGHFNVTANKDANGMIALNIEASTIEAKEFFKENEVKLLKNLDMKGVRVADFKIHTATSGQMSDTASQSESFKNEKRNSERQADKISTSKMTGNEPEYARQLNSEDSFAFDSFQDARESRQRRWQEYSERIGA